MNEINSTNINSTTGNIGEITSTKVTADVIDTNNLTLNEITSSNGFIDEIENILLNSENIIAEKLESTTIISTNNTFTNAICDDLQAKNFTVVSDIRRKYDIEYNNRSSEFLDNINQVTFKYNGDTKNHIGFIAQEIEKYYPELIEKDDKGFLSVKYVEMIPLLLNYNKNLKSEIEKIKNLIKK